MDILIGYVFITVGVFMLTWGLLEVVKKIAQIEYHIERMNKQLDQYETKEKQEVKETV